MKKRHIWPEGHWNWPIEITHKQGVRCGDMIWVSGQVDLTPDGVVRNEGDIGIQATNAMANFSRVLESCDTSFADLVKVLCFYVNDGGRDENDVLSMIAATLPGSARCAVTMVPVPYLAYPGMEIEIEGYAMRGADGRAMAREHVKDGMSKSLPAQFVQAVRCGKMIFVSAQTAIDESGVLAFPDEIIEQTKQAMSQVGTALGTFGADFDDVVKMNRWYVGHGTVEDFEPAALACAENFTKPGPAATGIPLPRQALPGQKIKLECVAMLGEDGSRLPRRHVWPDTLWDWTIPLPYQHGLKCHDMIFLGGQVSLDKQGRAVHPGKLTAQTRQAMDHVGAILRELGADYSDVCKVTTVYEGGCDHDHLHDNLSIRSSYFADPGPATTGIPLPKLAYPQMMIEIDIFAMADPD